MIKIALLLDFTEEYHKSLLKGIIRYSREKGPWLFLRMPVHYRDTLGVDGIIKWAKEWGANGLIGQLHSRSEIGKFRQAGIAVIAQDFEEPFSDIPNISGDYAATGRMGADHFLKKGYQHFAFYGFMDMVWSRERAFGYEARVKEAGFQVHQYQHKKSRATELWYYKPSALIKWLKSLPKPIALMACDDNQALHITEASKHAGLKVPEDVAVLGVDNDESVCYLSDPPLSSIGLDIEKGGYEAASLMEKLLQSKKKKQFNIIIKPTGIHTRASTNAFATRDELIDATLKLIHDSSDANLRVGDVLKEIPLSRRSLEKRFQEVMGMPVYKYIIGLRMERFKRRLEQSDDSISDIAHDLGLPDTKNIARQFKLLTGYTPGEYRVRFSRRK